MEDQMIRGICYEYIETSVMTPCSHNCKLIEESLIYSFNQHSPPTFYFQIVHYASENIFTTGANVLPA